MTTLQPLSGTDDTANIIDGIVRRVGSRHQGLVLTEALVATGYARDAAELRRRYRESPVAVDRYVQTVRVEQMLRAMVEGERELRSAQVKATAADNPIPLALLSFGTGLFVGWLVS